MKLFVLLLSVVLSLGAREGCGKKKMTAAAPLAAGCYKGRLEVKAACMNYTISIIGGQFDPSMVEPVWKDESTGKTYHNVFALGSRCSFPSRLNAGDEFYFKVDTTTVQHCMVCMIYYPVPAKHLSIKVLDQPCP